MALEVDGVNINAVEIDGQVLKTFEMDGNLLLAPPTITTQPVGATILDNQTRVISVVAQSLGKDIKYQWQRNGVNISGATGASYTHPAMAAGTYTYRCIISNKMGSITSNNAVITVNVSWQATNTLTVGTAGGWYGYANQAIGDKYGSLSPLSAGGYSIGALSAWSSPTNITFSVKGVNLNGRAFRIEFGSSAIVMTGTLTYDSQTNTSFFWGNFPAAHNWIKSNLGKAVPIRITF